MSGLYAYCVLAAGRCPPHGLVGLHDAAVTTLHVAGLSVWVSEAEARPAPEIDAVSRHHDVVSAAMDEAVVPFRFGAWVSGPGVLEERVAHAREELESALHKVEGRVELGVRIVEAGAGEPRPENPTPATGREYLRALSAHGAERAARRRRQDEIAAGAADRLADVATDQRLTYLDAPDLVALAHLVSRRDEAYYRTAMETFAEDLAPGYRVHVTGPWPPYSFTGA